MKGTGTTRLLRAFALAFVLLLAMLPTASAFAAEYTAQAKLIKVTQLKINKTSVTLKVGSDGGNTVLLKCSAAPTYASVFSNPSLLSWSSSKPSVASVNFGNVTALKPGTTTITARMLDGSKKKVSCKVTVKAVAPTKLSMSGTTLSVGESGLLNYSILPGNAYNKSMKFSSSNSKIATVNSSGIVTGVRTGKVTITGKTVSGGKKATCTVYVTAKPANSQKYYFYGIGNSAYAKSPLPSCAKDIQAMRTLFSAASFGGARVNVKTSENLSGVGILSFLNAMASNTAITENDVTYFYYTGHGLDSNFARGALVGVDLTTVSVDTVRSYLDKIPGRVIVIMDSCYSGQFIQSKDASGKSNVSMEDLQAYNQAVIDAFAGPQSKALTDSPYKNKYKILTACSPLEPSYALTNALTDDTFGVLTRSIQEGVSGTSMSADTNKNGLVTLNELYVYARARVLAYLASMKVSQSVQVWPSNDSTTVYAKN